MGTSADLDSRCLNVQAAARRHGSQCHQPCLTLDLRGDVWGDHALELGVCNGSMVVGTCRYKRIAIKESRSQSQKNQTWLISKRGCSPLECTLEGTINCNSTQNISARTGSMAAYE